MKTTFRLMRTTTLLLILIMSRISTADIGLEIQDIAADAGSGSFVIFANPDGEEDFALGTYSVNVMFDEFQGAFDSISVDAMNLVENMDVAGAQFGTTELPASLETGGVLQFVGFGSGVLPGAGTPLFQVDFTVDGPFDAASSFNVSTVELNSGAAVPAVGVSYIAGQTLTFNTETIGGTLALCDVDGSGVCDAEDIDFLSEQVLAGSDDLQYDLNADDAVNADDRLFWINNLMNTYAGDSNLDGVFSTTDLIAVFAAGEYEDELVANSSWATGDWNGDNEVDTSDLTFAFAEGGFELGPRGDVQSVPEPSSIAILILPILALFRLRRLS